MNIIETNLKFAYTPGFRSRNDELMIHHFAGSGFTIEQLHQMHLNNGWAGVAYHYYVRKDGKIYRGRPETWLGGHTTNHSQALGICFEGNFETDTMPQAQINAGIWLVNNIRGRYPNIRVRKHKDVNATQCPGRNFPWDAIVNPPTSEPTNTDAEDNDEAPPWAKEACDWAIAQGIFKGDENGKFNWMESVRRAELAIVLYRMALLAQPDGK